MTPHISGSSLSAQARYTAGTREILESYFAGKPIRTEYAIGNTSEEQPSGGRRRGVPAEVRAPREEGRKTELRMAESDFGSRYSAQSKQEHVMRKVIRGYCS
jgi:hypothetical protein